MKSRSGHPYQHCQLNVGFARVGLILCFKYQQLARYVGVTKGDSRVSVTANPHIVRLAFFVLFLFSYFFLLLFIFISNKLVIT